MLAHVIRRGGDVLVEGREVRVFVRRDPQDPTRIQSADAPAELRAACEG